ncbi:hypothetical protein T265_11256 [Opisthorchis viverrini]|uniref:Uncharacterized protein n=1 Tax=Opisthorchis viverrini TaxID=6198 RepID=A0A074YZA4_OPIVI|nr:hypothetical protein T265_11256 [Opisthorchis viverrini]KER20121.1 hypothetical protein T265_11256 [Opisthorchis viverrini]
MMQESDNPRKQNTMDSYEFDKEFSNDRMKGIDISGGGINSTMTTATRWFTSIIGSFNIPEKTVVSAKIQPEGMRKMHALAAEKLLNPHVKQTYQIHLLKSSDADSQWKALSVTLQDDGHPAFGMAQSTRPRHRISGNTKTVRSSDSYSP